MTSVAARLARVAGPAARIEARWIEEAAAGDPAKLEAMLARRLAGEPVDRILGSRGFWTLDLAVHPGVLSPRSDTETIVRAALARARALRPADHPWRILDWGTGSGAILLALLAELPGPPASASTSARRRSPPPRPMPRAPGSPAAPPSREAAG